MVPALITVAKDIVLFFAVARGFEWAYQRVKPLFKKFQNLDISNFLTISVRFPAISLMSPSPFKKI